MKSLSDRVTQAVNASGKSASAIAREIGVTPEAVLQWMNGPTKNLRNDNLFRLADATGFSARWIGTGEGSAIDRYSDSRIQHALACMERMTEADLTTYARMGDAFLLTPANHGEFAVKREQ